MGVKDTWDELDKDLKRIQEDIARQEELSAYLRNLIDYANERRNKRRYKKEEREG